MELIYNVPTKAYYSVRADETFYDEREIHYEPEYDELLDALADILVSNTNTRDLTNAEYKLAIKIAKKIIEGEDLFDSLCDEYHDELKEWFEEEAKEQWLWNYTK